MDRSLSERTRFSQNFYENTWECGKYFIQRSKISILIKTCLFFPPKRVNENFKHWFIWPLFIVKCCQSRNNYTSATYFTAIWENAHTCRHLSNRKKHLLNIFICFILEWVSHTKITSDTISTIQNSKNTYSPNALKNVSLPLHGIPAW